MLGGPGDSPILRKELGIYDWLLSRSPRLWGTPEDMSRRLVDLAEMGFTNWLFHGGFAGPDKLDFVKKVTKGILPNFV